MARKYRRKNRYCWDTKLPEPVFLALLKQYCKGRNASETARVLERWRKSRGFKRVSRQSVTDHFLRIGDFLFAKLDWKARGVPFEEWGRILMHMFDVMNGDIDFDAHWKELEESPDNLIFYRILRSRSKRHGGLDLERFAAHVGYATWKRTAIVSFVGIKKYVSNPDASTVMFRYLLDLFLKEPIGSVRLDRIVLYRPTDIGALTRNIGDFTRRAR